MYRGCYCTCCVQHCGWQESGWCSQCTDIVYSTVDGRSQCTDIVYSAVDGRSQDGVVTVLTLCTALWMAGVRMVQSLY